MTDKADRTVERPHSGALSRLSTLEAEYRAACVEAELLRGERNALVRAALEGGATHAQVAAITGLSRGRIGQLAR